MTTPRSRLLKTSAAAALLAAAVLAGCATAPPAEQRMAPPAAGTVITYTRSSTGSFGAFEGPVAWTQSRRQLDGRDVAVSTSNQGVNVYDVASGRQLGTLTRDGKPAVSYDPPLGFDLPLVVGKQWTSRYQVTAHASGRTFPVEVQFAVKAWERIRVPAGEFDTFRIEQSDSLGETTRQWVAPGLNLLLVKRETERPAGHPQGAGTLKGELTVLQPPTRP